MRANMASLFLAITLSSVLVAGCAITSVRAPEPEADLSAVGATLFVAEFQPQPASAAALSADASGIAAVVAGVDVPTIAPEELSRASSASPGRADLLVESASNIRVHVDAAQGELLAINGVVADDTISTVDVGAARARSLFEESIKSLKSRRLVDSEGLAPSRVRTGRVMQAETPRGGQTTQRVKEYFFETPIVVGQVEVFGASVTISIHRSGRIASIRTLGPMVSRAKDTFRRTISAASLSERARQEYPGAEVVPLGLRYPWKAARSDVTVVLRPREAFRIVPVTVTEGRTIHSRAHYVFYAVDDEKEPPIIWPTPNPNATGDSRK